MSGADWQWKVRFGQIFQHQLAQRGLALADWLYLQEEGVALQANSPQAAQPVWDKIDLHSNGPLYNAHFKAAPPPSFGWDNTLPSKLPFTLVFLPGIGNHLMAVKTMHDAMEEARAVGFKVINGWYEESLGDNTRCARHAAARIMAEGGASGDLLLLGYSKGGQIALELATNPEFAAIAARTKMIITLASPIRGTPAADGWLAKGARLALSIYSRAASPWVRRWMDWARWLTGWLFTRLNSRLRQLWSDLWRQMKSYEADLAGLPEGIEALSTPGATGDYSGRQVGPSTALFSLSAVLPQSQLEAAGRALPPSLDDLFLYFSSFEMYEHHPFNDSQVEVSGSRFFPANGPALDLGLLRGHHWAVAIPRVLNKGQDNPFPRRVLIRAMLLTLAEWRAAHP